MSAKKMYVHLPLPPLKKKTPMVRANFQSGCLGPVEEHIRPAKVSQRESYLQTELSGGSALRSAKKQATALRGQAKKSKKFELVSFQHHVNFISIYRPLFSDSIECTPGALLTISACPTDNERSKKTPR